LKNQYFRSIPEDEGLVNSGLRRGRLKSPELFLMVFDSEITPA